MLTGSEHAEDHQRAQLWSWTRCSRVTSGPTPDEVAATDNPRVLKYQGRARRRQGRHRHRRRLRLTNPPSSATWPRHGDAVAVGEIFSSPPAQMFYDAFRAADAGRGVACLYGNYAGDNMNVKMAVEMAADEGIAVKTVVANDDVPSAPQAKEREKRRGVAGEVLMWKVGGAKAAMGGDPRRCDRRGEEGPSIIPGAWA